MTIVRAPCLCSKGGARRLFCCLVWLEKAQQRIKRGTDE